MAPPPTIVTQFTTDQVNCTASIELFCFYGDYIYVPDRFGNIFQFNLDGTQSANYVWFTYDRIRSCVGYFDGVNNYLYFTFNQRIFKILINPDGSPGPFDPVTNLVTTFSNTLYGLAVTTVAGIDYLILVDYPTGQIGRLVLSTGLIDPFWGTITFSGSYGCVVHNGYVYVANASKGIYKISLIDSTDTSIWQDSTTLPGCLTYPVNIVVYNDDFYVSNFENPYFINKISITSPTLKSKANWVTPATPINSLSEPQGMAVYNNFLYVLSSSSFFIYKINLPEILPCFKEGTKILTDQGYKLVEDLRKGDLVKTLRNDYLHVEMIGKREMRHAALEERIKDQLYQCSQSEYPEVFEPLIITGCHSILVDDFVSEEQKEKTVEVLGKIYVTDKKYRLPACVDERASVYEVPGDYTIYHIALENEHYTANYGIYANGLLVETCSKRYLKELSEMELIE